MRQAIQVQSQSLTALVHDSESRTLQVTFSNGSVYRYFDVPRWQFKALVTAPSIGRFVNTVIKPGYIVTKVQEVPYAA